MSRISDNGWTLCAGVAGLLMAASVATAQTSTTATPVAAKPGDHVLKLTNQGRQAVTAIYYAQQGTTDWSDDLLGSQTAGPGRTVTLKIKDPAGVCVFDLQFLMSDGANVNKKGVNVCDPPAYSFTP